MMARLFLLTVFAYPLALALLCLGAGLLLDRCSGRFLPAPLLPSAGAATLIGLSQLSTLSATLAPATPYLMAAAALLGFVLTGARPAARRALLARCFAARWLLLAPLLAYLLAIAPVLLAGRASFSSFMALSDSAVHMIGADYLIHHGQHYAGLDLRNSYGQFIHGYYGTAYPSGADTMFGGSALLLGLPLIWAFSPFNALILTLACGPAWLLARHSGLARGWAALAALTATLPALLYGYNLIGSVKELTALVMLLTLGALAVLHRRWLTRSPLHVLPCALVLAAGVSALGVGFGAWALVFAAVLCVLLLGELHARRLTGARLLAILLVGGLALLLAALPTWLHVSQSLHVAQNVASTANPGNLQAPLKWTQAFGVWLHGSYKESPAGSALLPTQLLIALAMLACLLGAFHLLRTRRWVLCAWIALVLLAWLILSRSATTWVDAKALVLTSPVVVLLAWAGVAALLGSSRAPARAGGAGVRRGRDGHVLRPRRAPAIPALAVGFLLALLLAGGALASDLAQYHSSNLAPTARYDELASINRRFAGRGPTLFTDFDEYSLYVLRDLDIGGPDFVFPPPAARPVANGYPVELDHISPQALAAYPLIVTPRDPSASPPPAAYALAWQGTYYEVWARRPAARPALVHVAAPAGRALSCTRVVGLAHQAGSEHAALIAALSPSLVRVRLRGARLPAGWGHQHGGFTMRRPGTVALSLRLPRAGRWELWLQGQFMPMVRLGLDGRPVASISGQLAGNSLVPDTAAPITLQLGAGLHRLTVARAGFSLAPGNGGSAVLDHVFLTPAGAPVRRLRSLSPGASPRALCAGAYRWIELVPR